MKAYLRGNPGQVDWRKVNIENYGYRLVEENEQRYLGDKAAAWDLNLKPRPAHVDIDEIVVRPVAQATASVVARKPRRAGH